jgi:acetylglutamate kinase
LLNTNADTVAQELAKALSKQYPVDLIYSFEKPGVLLHPDDDSTLVPELNEDKYHRLQTEGVISGGMIPKLDNAFEALHAGVNRVIIGRAEELGDLIKGSSGTTIRV